MLTDNQISKLFTSGFVELPNLKFNSDQFNLNEVVSNSENIYNTNSSIHDKYSKEFKIKTRIKDQLIELSKKYLNISVNKNDLYCITRVVKSFDNKESYRGHFDSHLFTLVTPVNIPKTNDNESGQLILFPNLRKEPKYEFMNIIDKIYYKIFYSSQDGFKKLMKNKNFEEFDFKNNIPVLFLGRQSFHGNRGFAKAPKGVRVTLLTHFFDPSPKYGIGNILRLLRKR